jgi:hypothetical protein
LLLYGSASVHKLLLVQQKLNKQDTMMLPHPPYAVLLAQHNFYPYPQVKDQWKVCQVKDAPESHVALKTVLQETLYGSTYKCFKGHMAGKRL